MKCLIKIPYSVDVRKLYELGLDEAIATGGRLDGNEQKGTFSIPILGGVFEGTYNVNNKWIEVQLFKKPIFIPCGVIESFLKSQIK